MGQHRQEIAAAEAQGDVARLAEIARDLGGRFQNTEDILARQLVAQEQAAIDGGVWRAAWLLTHLAEPPWQKLQPAPKKGTVRPVPKLSDPAWRAIAAAYITDLAALEELTKRHGKGKGEGKAKGEE